jgi:hypothetical protein
MYFSMRRAFSTLTILAACGILSGCGGAAEEHSQRPEHSTQTPATAAQTTVVLQMTGALLIVPPTGNAGATNILLPSTRGMANSHIAWFGFGMASGDPLGEKLCVAHPEARARGICYVDLSLWSVDSIGAGGSPSTPAGVRFPTGLVNLTSESGNSNKVNFAALAGKIRSQIVLLSGQPGDSCSLGKWTFDDHDPAQDSLKLVNVLNWEIKQSQDNLLLRFKSKSDSTNVLNATARAEAGTIALLIAHVPKNERADLPPNVAGTVTHPSGTVRADHFKSMYDLLRVPQNANHRIPTLRRTVRNRACSVIITNPVARIQKDRRMAFPGLKTQACMPALAEAEP